MRRLTGFLNCDSTFLFHAVAFTDFRSYQEFKREHIVEFLLCGRSFYEQATSSFHGGKICILSDREEVAEQGKQEVIFKFQSAEDIKKEILRLYEKKDSVLEEPSLSEDVKVLGFLSPAGGCFCSTLALASAVFFAEYYRTVFISFDPFFTAERAGITLEQPKITEAIYWIRQGVNPEKEIAALAGHAEHLDYYVGCLHWADLTEIEPQEIIEFLNILSSQLKYQVIIIDGGTICRATAGLFSVCQMIYEPFFGTTAEEEKQKEWLRQCYMNDSEIDKKLHRIRPPYDERLADGLKGQKDLIEGVLGNFIKGIL